LKCRRSSPRSVIDLAAYLGAMVNIGRLRGQLKFLGDVDDPWPVAVERLRAVINYAADQGVRITMEPINRYETDFILSADDGMRLVEDLDCDNLGLMLDLFHMNIEDVSIEDGLRQTGDRLWHVHIADSNRRYPGSGHLNLDGIIDTLKDMNYQGYISAEMLPLPDPDTAAQKTIEFLQKHLN
jgi:sugar phosphate isomerase/epimerase